MISKKANRMRRAKRTRAKISELGAHRLTVHRTPRHIYAQVVTPDGSKVIASASTVQKTISGDAFIFIESFDAQPYVSFSSTE